MTESHYTDWLNYIQIIAYDRDGWHSAEKLGELVDELGQMAVDAIQGKECPMNHAGVE